MEYEHKAKEAARAAWVDEQMRHQLRRSMFDTISTGIAAGIGTTCSTIFVGIMKWAVLSLFATLLPH